MTFILQEFHPLDYLPRKHPLELFFDFRLIYCVRSSVRASFVQATTIKTITGMKKHESVATLLVQLIYCWSADTAKGSQVTLYLTKPAHK